MSTQKPFDSLTCEELCDLLVDKGILSRNEVEKLREREVDGAAFLTLSREDIALIYTDKRQFLLGSRLYKEMQNFRQMSVSPSLDTSESPTSDDLASVSDATSVSQLLKPGSKRQSLDSCSGNYKAKQGCSLLDSFSLPKFSPDVSRAAKDDTFHTAVLRNKLIRESCRALKGHWQLHRPKKPPTSSEKRELGKLLYKLAPKSLGDPEALAVAGVPEATLNHQIIKWFQNNSFTDRKCIGLAKQKLKSTPPSQLQHPPSSANLDDDDNDDHDTTKDDVATLQSELKKPKSLWNIDHIVRLLSITYGKRDPSCNSSGSQMRITKIVSEYPCFKEPIFIIQELFHKCGSSFQDLSTVHDLFKSVQEQWLDCLLPAMAAMVDEHSQDETQCVVTEMDCLQMVIKKLKPKCSTLSFQHRTNQIVCVEESLTACKQKHTSNDPYIAVIGSMEDMDACMLLCDGRVILTLPCGSNLASILLILIGFCHLFGIKYAAEVQDVMEFFQSQLLGISERTRHGVQYNNLYREMTVHMRRVQEERTVDDDETQLEFGYAESQVSLFSVP